MDDDYSEQVLGEVQEIKSALEAIRNGQYESPRGVNHPHAARAVATPDDIYNALTSIIGHLERQNMMLWELGAAITGDRAAWEERTSRH